MQAMTLVWCSHGSCVYTNIYLYFSTLLFYTSSYFTRGEVNTDGPLGRPYKWFLVPTLTEINKCYTHINYGLTLNCILWGMCFSLCNQYKQSNNNAIISMYTRTWWLTLWQGLPCPLFISNFGPICKVACKACLQGCIFCGLFHKYSRPFGLVVPHLYY